VAELCDKSSLAILFTAQPQAPALFEIPYNLPMLFDS
jgi:hypothetical protein